MFANKNGRGDQYWRVQLGKRFTGGKRINRDFDSLKEAKQRIFGDAQNSKAGVGYREPRRIQTEDGLPHVFAINTLAPYLLTALINRPKRLIYLSSGVHRSGDISLEDLAWERRPWQGAAAYSDSKLHDVLLAFAVARRWPEVLSNALEPGWVPTKMGGPGPSTARLPPLTRMENLLSNFFSRTERPNKPHSSITPSICSSWMGPICALDRSPSDASCWQTS